MLASRDRAASSARRSSSTLWAFGTSWGSTWASRGRSGGRRVRATSRTPWPPPRAAAPAASAASRRPGSVRSDVWAKPVVSPRTTRMPAPRSRPDVSSSTLPSSRRAADDRRSSTNSSAKSPPVRRAASRTLRTVLSSITPSWYGRGPSYLRRRRHLVEERRQHGPAPLRRLHLGRVAGALDEGQAGARDGGSQAFAVRQHRLVLVPDEHEGPDGQPAH